MQKLLQIFKDVTLFRLIWNLENSLFLQLAYQCSNKEWNI